MSEAVVKEQQKRAKVGIAAVGRYALGEEPCSSSGTNHCRTNY